MYKQQGSVVEIRISPMAAYAAQNAILHGENHFNRKILTHLISNTEMIITVHHC